MYTLENPLAPWPVAPAEWTTACPAALGVAPTESAPGAGVVVPEYCAATMLACTAASVVADGKPAVMTPSKNDPTSAWLLSPPVPSTIPPSWSIGWYWLGSAPS